MHPQYDRYAGGSRSWPQNGISPSAVTNQWAGIVAQPALQLTARAQYRPGITAADWIENPNWHLTELQFLEQPALKAQRKTRYHLWHEMAQTGQRNQGRFDPSIQLAADGMGDCDHKVPRIALSAMVAGGRPASSR